MTGAQDNTETGVQNEDKQTCLLKLLLGHKMTMNSSGRIQQLDLT